MARGMVSIERTRTTHLALVNDTGAKLTQNDFAVVGGYAVIADQDVAAGAEGSFNVEQGILVQAGNLHATENAFDTIGDVIYWDETSKTFSDTEDAAYDAVGILVEKKDSDGIIVFDKRRYALQ